MPYYIKQGAIGCDGWATIKEDGEVIGCHQSKADAIAQMVAISLAEDMEPGGERALPSEVVEGAFVEWFDEDAIYRGQIEYVMTEGTFGVEGGEYSLEASADDPVVLVRKWKPEPEEGYWEPEEELIGKRASELIVIAPLVTEPVLPPLTEESERAIEVRVVDLSAPEYMVSAAKRGLRLYADGEAGAGLEESTVRDARAMAQGTISEAKWRKIGPWIARHIDDLDAVDAETPITPGLVAHLLWGSGPSKSDAERAQNYAEGIVERLNAEEERTVNKTFHISKREEIEAMRTTTEQPTQVETRRVTVQEFELRAGDAGSMSFRGYAAVYNSPSEPLPFTETIAPGAFDKTLRSRNNVKMYLNHDSTLVLASTRAKTMKLTSDSKGLLVESDLPDTSYARDLAVLMERGDVDSMSFGFSVPSGGDRWSPDGMTRELKQIRLHEVSVVTGFPAYSATSAALRSLDMLADATGLDANKLAEALTMLENGKPLSTDHADLLTETVAKLRGEPDTSEVAGSLALKRKQIDLLLNRI